MASGWTLRVVHQVAGPVAEQSIDGLLQAVQVEEIATHECVCNLSAHFKDRFRETGERLNGFADREVESSKHQGVQAAR
jgi:hypothetical protein